MASATPALDGPRQQAPPQAPPADLKSRLKESYDAIAPKYNAWTEAHSGLRRRYLDKLLGYLLPPSPQHHPGDTATISCGPGREDGRKNRVFRVLELGCGAGIPVTETLVHFNFAGKGGPEYASCAFHIVANDLSQTQVDIGMSKLGGNVYETASTSTPTPASGSMSTTSVKGVGVGSGLGKSQNNNKLEWIQGDMMSLSFPDESFDAIIGLYSLIHLPREEQEVMIGRIGRWLKRPSSSTTTSSHAVADTDRPGSEKTDRSTQGGGIMLLNFSGDESEHDVMDKWLGEEKGWMYWSGWGAEKTLEIVSKSGGQAEASQVGKMEVLFGEVVKEPEDGVDVGFLWVIARRTG